MAQSIKKTKETKEKQYHIGCQSGDLANYLLLPGDPKRVKKLFKSGIKGKRK